MTFTPMNLGSRTIANRQEAVSSGNAPESPAHRKLRKAAQEFEGILISELWGDFKDGFSTLTGDAPLAGSDTLNSLAIQTLSSALASRGGLGIAKMLVHQLEPSLNRGQGSEHRWTGSTG